MTCSHCGFTGKSRMRFCPECGAEQSPAARRSRLRGARGRHPASRFRLADPKGDLAVEIPWNRLIRVGRHPSTDLTLLATSVSRFHAELVTTEDGCVVRDLDSSNGTFVNGVSVRELTLRDGDELRFGSVAFQVEARAPDPTSPDSVAERPGTADRTPRHDHLAQLAMALAHRMDGTEILERLVEGAVATTGADRASIALVVGEPAEIETGVFYARGAERAGRHVPRSIARHCLHEGIAVITEAAERDHRFDGNSIVSLGVRSAMCAPIMGASGAPIGVCYLDHTSNHEPFTSADLDYLVALTGIAAAVLERDI